jgi:hypothetical protein
LDNSTNVSEVPSFFIKKKKCFYCHQNYDIRKGKSRVKTNVFLIEPLNKPDFWFIWCVSMLLLLIYIYNFFISVCNIVSSSVGLPFTVPFTGFACTLTLTRHNYQRLIWKDFLSKTLQLKRGDTRYSFTKKLNQKNINNYSIRKY